MTTPCPLVLASSSRYRRTLLERFGLPFECHAPEVDESQLGDETPSALALRLAETKARAVSRQRPGALVIGSDHDGFALLDHLERRDFQLLEPTGIRTGHD